MFTPNDFIIAKDGIRKLPKDAKFAVLTAFYYYQKLLRRIKKTPVNILTTSRIQVPNGMKIVLIIDAFFAIKFKVL